MDSFKDRFVTVRGVKTRYWQAGSEGSAVILLHGLAVPYSIGKQTFLHLPRAIVCML